MHFLRAAAFAIFIVSALATLLLQSTMAGETKTERAGLRVTAGLPVDSGEFTARGLKLRDWRRVCLVSALAFGLWAAWLDHYLSLTSNPS